MNVLKLRNIRLWEHRKLWFCCFVIGIFVNGIPWVCFNFSLQSISSLAFAGVIGPVCGGDFGVSVVFAMA